MHERRLWCNNDKKTLDKMLMSGTVQHLITHRVKHFIAGNGLILSFRSRGVTNYKEGGTVVSLTSPEMD